MKTILLILLSFSSLGWAHDRDGCYQAHSKGRMTDLYCVKNIPSVGLVEVAQIKLEDDRVVWCSAGVPSEEDGSWVVSFDRGVGKKSFSLEGISEGKMVIDLAVNRPITLGRYTYDFKKIRDEFADYYLKSAFSSPLCD